MTRCHTLSYSRLLIGLIGQLAESVTRTACALLVGGVVLRLELRVQFGKLISIILLIHCAPSVVHSGTGDDPVDHRRVMKYQ